MRPGFGLLEALFSIVILAVVSGGVFTLFYSNTFGADLSGDASTAMVDAQTALRDIATDFRSGSAFATATHTGGARVTFSSGSPIEYYQSGTTLYRLVDATTPVTTSIVTDLKSGTGISLTYYDSSMNATTNLTQAAVVDITVTVTLSHAAFGSVTRCTRVVLRNMVS